ncbi:MAG: hypothetical protein ACTSQE_10690 [Candidatus Heimdallarchaeaceae archaeon]
MSKKKGGGKEKREMSEIQKAIIEAKKQLATVAEVSKKRYVKKDELENAIKEAIAKLGPVSQDVVKHSLGKKDLEIEVKEAKAKLKPVPEDKKVTKATKKDLELAIRKAMQSLQPITDKEKKHTYSKNDLELAVLDAFANLQPVSEEAKRYALNKKDLELVFRDARAKLRKVSDKEKKHVLTKKERMQEIKDAKAKLKPTPSQVKRPQLSIKQLRTAIKDARVRLKPVPDEFKSMSSISIGRTIKEEGEIIKRKLLPIPGDVESFEIEDIEHIKSYTANKADLNKYLSKMLENNQKPLLRITINPKTQFNRIELLNKDDAASIHNIVTGGDLVSFGQAYRFLHRYGYIKIDNPYPLLFSDKQWQVWYLKEAIGLTFVDVAYTMHMSVRACRSLYNEASDRVQQILDFAVSGDNYQLVAAHAMKKKGVLIHEIGDTLIEPAIDTRYYSEEQQLEELLARTEEIEEELKIPREWTIKTAYKKETLRGGYYLWKEWLGCLKNDQLLMIENDALPHEEKYFEQALGFGEEILPDIPVNFERLIDLFAHVPSELIKIGDVAFFIGNIDSIYASQFWNIKHFTTEDNIREWQKRFTKIAINSYKKALESYNNKDTPLEYAKTQNDLGNFYLYLAELEEPKENCFLAIKAYQEALTIYSPEFFKLEYSHTNHNMGIAYQKLAIIDESARNSKLAILAYKEALKGRTVVNYPLENAMTYVNLGMLTKLLLKKKKQELILHGL